MNPFVQEYKVEGARLGLISGHPVKMTIAQGYAKTQVPFDNLYVMSVAGFWILEGLLVDYELDPQKYPRLSYYLENREGLLFPQRWQLYIESIQDNELDLLRLAHDSTRQHVLETMAELPLEEKKSE